ncbi:MAG: dihydroxyacetone kinase subunit DhaL [Paracoccus sp. (in: a-proteobacteria)]|uniref:dihydroxyacetone kinase subunit DhaL n=1 Tax=Paracoccus sp. TaxID=267 RepID=UPI0039E6DCA5
MNPLAAPQIVDLFRVVARRLAEARADLGALDGAIGDGDHGNSMAEGFAAVVRAGAEAAGEGVAAGDLFAIGGSALLNAVGATTGPLYASALHHAGLRFAGQAGIPAEEIPALVAAFAEGIAARGKARPGDKTMMDAWGPAARAAQGPGDALARLDRALHAASEGRDATRAMIASVGRAARLGERSLGNVDPGAASAVIVIAALREGLARHIAGPES